MIGKRLNLERVAEIIRLATRDKKESIPLHAPQFEGNEWKYVKDCLDSGWVSSVGSYVNLFEKQLAEYTGVKRAVAVVNGTAALHISLVLAGVESSDEVLIPSMTFIATANAVSYCYAIPHFVDVEESSLGVDPVKLEGYLNEIAELRSGFCYNRLTGRRIRAFVPMHTFGHPVRIDELEEICRKYHMILIEDAAESLGSFYRGKHTGNWGTLSAMSFNGNKILTTGGGGALLTNDDKLADQAKHLTTTAKLPHRWAFEHDRIGYNYRMPNINAALGCAQIEQLPRFLQKKRELAHHYNNAFQGMDGVTFFTELDHMSSNYWLNTIILDEDIQDQRDALLSYTNDQGIMTRPVWEPMHTLTMYASCPRMDLTVTEGLARRMVNIPSSVIAGGDCE